MKYLGIGLAVGSGVLIGASFVFKKKGLLAAQKKYQTQAGESYAYLKSPMWWTGMIMMILGEVLNLIAYAVTSAVLVTPLGALAVVVCVPCSVAKVVYDVRLPIDLCYPLFYIPQRKTHSVW